MFFVVIKAFRKHTTGATERFVPKQTTSETWNISGPFSTRRVAERAAVKALGGYVVQARVASGDELLALGSGRETDYQLSKLCKETVKLHCPGLLAEGQ